MKTYKSAEFILKKNNGKLLFGKKPEEFLKGKKSTIKIKSEKNQMGLFSSKVSKL